MTIMFLLILISIVLALAFLVGFIWAVRSGQYEDTCTPSMRVLCEEGGLERNARKFETMEVKTET